MVCFVNDLNSLLTAFSALTLSFISNLFALQLPKWPLQIYELINHFYYQNLPMASLCTQNRVP